MRHLGSDKSTSNVWYAMRDFQMTEITLGYLISKDRIYALKPSSYLDNSNFSQKLQSHEVSLQHRAHPIVKLCEHVNPKNDDAHVSTTSIR